MRERNRKSTCLRSVVITLLLLTAQGALYAFGTMETVEFSDTPGTIIISHQIDSTTQEPSTISLLQTFLGGRNSKYMPETTTEVTMSAGISGTVYDRELVHTNGTDILHYNIYDNTIDYNILKDPANNNGPDDVLYYIFPSVYVPRWSTVQQTKTHNFIIEIPDGQFVPAGTYTDDIELRLYRNGAILNSETTDMTISVDVEASVGLSIVDVGGLYNPTSTSYTMDFGVLEEGESMSAQAVARSNTSYSISVSSQNGGQMKHDTVPEYVPYNLTFDGSSVNFGGSSAPVNIITNAPPTTATGTSYPIDVVIESFGWIQSGLYSDNLTFEITSN